MTESEIVKHVSQALRSRYTASLKKSESQEDAYQAIYPQVVRLVSEKLGISESKTEFEARGVLQQIIRALSANSA